MGTFSQGPEQEKSQEDKNTHPQCQVQEEKQEKNPFFFVIFCTRRGNGAGKEYEKQQTHAKRSKK